MKRYIMVSFVLTLTLACSLRAADKSEPAEEFTVNGLKVIVKPNPANQIVSAQLYLRGGALNLHEETQGIEPLIFNCAVRGSKNYPKEELNRILDRTAARITSFSNRDFSSVSLRCIRRNFDETWDVFADVVLNPAFEPDEVEIERDRMLVNVRQRKDNPDVYLRDIVNELFYQGHPYRLRPQGVVETISNITIAQMRDYLQDKLKTSNLLLVVVGDVDKEKLRKKVAETFGRLPKGDASAKFPEMVKHTSANLVTEERKLPTNYIIGLFSAPSPKDPDFYPMVMAMDILGWRVWEEVRTKRNLSYAPNAFFSNSFANYGGIYVTAVEPDTTIKVMIAELKKMQNEKVSAKDLRDRITMYLTRYYLNNETNAAQARFLAMFELSGLGWKASDAMVDNLRTVTAEDVMQVAKRYFHDLQFAVLGNPQLIDEKLFTIM